MTQDSKIDKKNEANKNAISKFIESMNIKAKAIGMSKSKFSNPHGLWNDKQTSTPKDILLMMVHAAGYRELMDVMGRRNFVCRVEGKNAREIIPKTTIKDSSIDDNYTILASKTGRIPRLTTNLAAIVDTKDENTALVAVTFEGRTRYEALKQLFDIGNTALHSKIKILPHEVMFKNGNFDFGEKNWRNNSGPFELDHKDYFSYPASFVATSRGTSTQIHTGNLDFQPNHKYYVSCMVKCTRYQSGTIGFQFTGSSKRTTVGLKRVTDGWEKVSGVFTAAENPKLRRVYFGGIDKADLDGRVDNATIIDLTTVYGSGQEPAKERMDEYHYHDLSAGKGIVAKMPHTLVSYNPDNLPVLFEKNSEEIGYPASLTKVLTAMIFLDNFTDLNKKIIIQKCDMTGGSGTKLIPGDILSLRDALYTMMIESSNTIANAFARITGQKLLDDEN